MSTCTDLTDEQRARIAKNKEEALRRREARLARERAEAGGCQTAQTQIITSSKPSATQEIVCLSGADTQPINFVPKSFMPQFIAPKPYAACASAVSTSAPKPAAAPQQVPPPVQQIKSVQPPQQKPNPQPVVQQKPTVVQKPTLQPINHDVTPMFGPKNPQNTTRSPAPGASKPAHRPPAMARMPKSQVQVTFTFMSADRIKVVFYPYHQSIKDAIKRLPSWRWDDKTRVWSIGLEDLRQAVPSLKAVIDCNVTVESIPENVLQIMTNFSIVAVPDDLSTVIDGPIVEKLFPYQKGGVKFVMSRGGRAMIADEMGLGKSVQALAAARIYRSEWPLMIVCPSSVKAAWQHQIKTFLPVIQKIFTVEKGSDPLPDSQTSNTVVIMSYDMMTAKVKELENKQYQVIILDECHMLKDGKAGRTKAATTLSKLASRVIMLSGTPAVSRPCELFSQIRIINKNLFTNYHKFAVRYCDGKQGRFCFEDKGCTNSEELSAILSRRIMIRRLKDEVLTDLPEKRREVVYLSGSSIDSRMDSLQKAKAAFEAANGELSDNNQSLLEYYSATGIVKAAAVCDHILDTYFHKDAVPKKVLIFGHHQVVLDTLQVEVNKRNLRSIRIDGSTPTSQRGALCDQFQTDPNVVVAILSMTAAGVGITLTAASVVVFAELSWNPGTITQAEDRAHRIGQKDSVYVQILVARNTADDHIWPLLQGKLDLLGQVNLSSDTFRDADSTHMDCGTPAVKRRKNKGSW